MTEEQLRKAAMLWREWRYDTLRIADFLGVQESVVYNRLGAILRKCPAEKRATA